MVNSPKLNNRSVILNNLRDLLNNFNNDYFFKKANIRFSMRVDHFCDRIVERNFDPIDVFLFLKKMINDKKCEVIYCCYLEKKPIRLNVVTQNFILCFSIFSMDDNNTILTLRTITKNTQKFSRVSTFILQ